MGKILALGEIHHGTHTEDIQKIVKNAGPFDGVFYESSVSHQESINGYTKTGELDQILTCHFEGALKEGNDVKGTLVFLMDYAKRNDVPFVCIDSSKRKTEEYNAKSEHGHWFLNGESRDEDMFNKISEYYVEDEYWLLVCGLDHLKLGKHHRTGKDTLGERLSKRYNEKLQTTVLS